MYIQTCGSALFAQLRAKIVDETLNVVVFVNISARNRVIQYSLNRLLLSQCLQQITRVHQLVFQYPIKRRITRKTVTERDSRCFLTKNFKNFSRVAFCCNKVRVKTVIVLFRLEIKLTKVFSLKPKLEKPENQIQTTRNKISGEPMPEQL